MRVSLNWLKDYVDVALGADELAHRLTMAGLEVSRVERVGEGIGDVVVAQLLERGQHPNADGLDDIRKILEQAARHLRDDGSLLLEHGYDQAQAVRELFAAHAFREVFSVRDLAGIERISGGVCPRRQTDPSAPKIV